MAGRFSLVKVGCVKIMRARAEKALKSMKWPEDKRAMERGRRDCPNGLMGMILVDEMKLLISQ